MPKTTCRHKIAVAFRAAPCMSNLICRRALLLYTYRLFICLSSFPGVPSSFPLLVHYSRKAPLKKAFFILLACSAMQAAVGLKTGSVLCKGRFFAYDSCRVVAITAFASNTITSSFQKSQLALPLPLQLQFHYTFN